MKIDSNIKNYDILKQAKQKIPSFETKFDLKQTIIFYHR